MVTHFTSTIREKLALEPDTIKIPNESSITKVVQSELPSHDHLTDIFYYLYLNNWIPTKGILF